MSTATASGVAAPSTTKQKVGLALCGLLSLVNVPSVAMPTPDGETGPPLGILVIGSALGVIGLVCTVLAWRGSAVALRVAAGAIIICALTAVPAFFVDVPTGLKAAVGAITVLTVAAVALMFSGRRSGPVVD